MPIDQISTAVKSQLSPATPGTIYVDVEEEVTEKDSAKKVKKVTSKKVDYWCVDSVAAELVLELNAIGRDFLRRRIAGKLNTIWLLFGGDKGGKPVASFKLGCIVLNQENPLSSLNVRLLAVVRANDTREVLVQTAMTPAVAAQLAELKQSVVVHVVSAVHRGSDAAHSCLIVPKGIAIATTASTSPVFVFLGEEDTLKTAPGHLEAPASECMGVLAVVGGFIIGLVVIHCYALHRSSALRIAAAGGCFSLEACKSFGVVVAFYGLAEQLHRGPVVFVEALELDQKLTADHELYRVVFGQQGSKARMPCWACLTKTLDERQGVARAEDRTYASLVACAAKFPTGAGKGTNAYKANEFCSIEYPPLLYLEPREETTKGPLHLCLGEFLRVYVALAKKCAEIDGVVNVEAATRIAELLLPRKERCTALDRAVVEVSFPLEKEQFLKILKILSPRPPCLRSDDAVVAAGLCGTRSSL
jgi:hypothetical protein